MLILFDDIIADTISNKKLNPIATELIIRETKLNVSLAFITQSYFAVSKDFRINSIHYFFNENSKQKKPSINCI